MSVKIPSREEANILLDRIKNMGQIPPKAPPTKKKIMWTLDKFEIERETYGNDKGKYKGRIRFGNENYESFTMNVRENTIDHLFALFADDIVNEAESIGDQMVEFLSQYRKDLRITRESAKREKDIKEIPLSKNPLL